MDFEDLIKKANYDWNIVFTFPDSGSNLDFEFEIEPEDFIKFAEIDLEQSEKRNLVNALSNAKRAIHCAADKLIAIFNLKSKNDFISKLNLLEDVGVIAPRIIRKVNKNRNFLEHHYKLPTSESVEDAIDIAVLFVAAIRGVLRSVMHDFYIKEWVGKTEEFDLKNAIYFNFDIQKKEWEIELHKGKRREFVSFVKSDSKYFKPLVKLMLAQESNPEREREVLVEFSNIK